MAVALDHLRSHRRDFEAKPLADFRFDLRTQVRAIPHRARDFSHGHLLRGCAKALEVAPVLRMPVGNLQAKGDRLGVDSVRAPDLRRVLEFLGAALEHFPEPHQAVLNEARRLADLQRLRRVHDVVRGKTVVQPACRLGIADGFAHGHRKRDDVVLHLGFQFIDARNINLGALPDRRRRFLWHLPGLGERIRCGDLNFQPSAETV